MVNLGKLAKTVRKVVDSKGDKIAAGVDKATDFVDKKTKGRFHDKLEKVDAAAEKLDKTTDRTAGGPPADPGQVDPAPEAAGPSAGPVNPAPPAGPSAAGPEAAGPVNPAPPAGPEAAPPAGPVNPAPPSPGPEDPPGQA